MSEQPKPDEATSTYEEPEEEPVRKKVRVPTARDATGRLGAYIDADEDAAWMWDSRRWRSL
jgi:hypothetical protein